jgi:hypothetical protein
MYFRDHNPPHFHARYGEHLAEIDLNGALISGWLPPRIAGFVTEWMLLHRNELMENWNLVSRMQNPHKISPLE